MTSFEEKYAPRSITDVVFPDAGTKASVEKYTKHGATRHLLLYGPPGTGKSTLAQIIPAAIQKQYPAKDLHKVAGVMDPSVDRIRNLNKTLMLYTWNGSGRHFVVVDEADELSRQALNAVKHVMDERKEEATFFLTTNYEDKLPPPIHSRCEKLFLPPSPPRRWLPRMRSIARLEGADIPNEMLLKLAGQAGSNNREVLSVLEEAVIEFRKRNKKVGTKKSRKVAAND